MMLNRDRETEIREDIRYQIEKGTANCIPPGRREMIFKVMDGEQRCLPILFQIQSVRQCDDILKWLHKANLTGVNLFDWLRTIHHNSTLGMLTYIINDIEKNPFNRSLFAGRDFI